MCVRARACACVFMCVRESKGGGKRKREREREREGGRERERDLRAARRSRPMHMCTRSPSRCCRILVSRTVAVMFEHCTLRSSDSSCKRDRPVILTILSLTVASFYKYYSSASVKQSKIIECKGQSIMVVILVAVSL